MGRYNRGIPTPRYETGPNCHGCSFRGKCFGFVPPENAIVELSSDGKDILSYQPKPNLEVWFVGEFPGTDEVRTGLPFQGGAGYTFNEIIYEAGIGGIRKHSYVTNVVKCRSVEYKAGQPYISPYTGDHKNANPSEEQQRECYNRYLKYELEKFDGMLFVALGAVAMKWLSDEKDMSKWHGTLMKTRHGHRLLSTWHPSYVQRKYAEKHSAVHDLARIPVYKSSDLPELSTRYVTRASVADLASLDLRESISVDTETVGEFDPDRGEIGVIGFCDRVGRAFVVAQTKQAKPGLIDAIKQIDCITGQFFYGFDAIWFLKKGYHITRNIRDTLTMHHVAYSEASHDLYSIQSNFADRPEPNWKTKGHYTKDTPLVCARDVDMTKRSEIGLTKYLYRQGQLDLYEKQVIPLQWTSIQLRLRGTKLDVEKMAKLHLGTRKYIRAREALLRGALGPFFNWNSPKELGKLLYDKMGLPEKYFKNKRTTRAEALDELYEQFPNLKMLQVLMQLRKATKLDGTYFQLDVDDLHRVYPFLMVHGTGTGRLACKEPTIHNIPDGPARQIFIPDHPGWVFVMGDYSQAEFVTQLWYGREWDALKRCVIDGYDFHKMVASLFFHVPYDQVTREQRHRAKFIDFGLIYGRGAASIALANNLTQAEVQKNIDQFFAGLPGVQADRQDAVNSAKDKGFVETAFHRRRWLRANEVTKIYNMKPQGTAADVTNGSLWRLFDAEDSDPIYLTPLTVHDSITLQCPVEYVPRAVERLQDIMLRHIPELPARRIGMPEGLQFRVEIKVGENWGSYDERTNPNGLRKVDEWRSSH